MAGARRQTTVRTAQRGRPENTAERWAAQFVFLCHKHGWSPVRVAHSGSEKQQADPTTLRAVMCPAAILVAGGRTKARQEHSTVCHEATEGQVHPISNGLPNASTTLITSRGRIGTPSALNGMTWEWAAASNACPSSARRTISPSAKIPTISRHLMSVHPAARPRSITGVFTMFRGAPHAARYPNSRRLRQDRPEPNLFVAAVPRPLTSPSHPVRRPRGRLPGHEIDAWLEQQAAQRTKAQEVK